MVQRIALLVCGLSLVGAQAASAQILAWGDYGFVNVNFGGQSKSNEIATSFAFGLYEETATVDINQKHGGGAFFDLSGGYRVWRNVAAGLSYFRRSADADGTLTASIPDPVGFNTPRTVTGSVSGLQRRETWIGFLGTYVIPVTDKMDVMAFGGPAFAKLTQQFVNGVSSSEGTSGPTVTTTIETVKKSYWGYQIGVDVRYLITKQLGAGGFLRISSADGTLKGDEKADMGGFQVGGGLRVKF
jgi:hypothetical protein